MLIKLLLLSLRRKLKRETKLNVKLVMWSKLCP
jgi:hypothetical protein